MDMQLSALLKLSRLGAPAINVEQLDMNRIVSEILKTLEFVAKEKGVKIQSGGIAPLYGGRGPNEPDISLILSKTLTNILM